MVGIYKTMTLPILEYGCIAWINVAEVHMKKHPLIGIHYIHYIHSSALRSCLHLPAYIAESTLHETIDITPVFQHLKDFATNRFLSISKSSLILSETINKYEGSKWNKHHISSHGRGAIGLPWTPSFAYPWTTYNTPSMDCQKKSSKEVLLQVVDGKVVN
jgi:hypothetical protein